MKKFVSLYILILLYFCATGVSYCAEDFFYQNGINGEDSTLISSNSTKLSSFFSKFKRKNKINTQEEFPKGYYGTLPDIEADFKYKQQSTMSSKREDIIVPDENIEKENLKEAPYNDTLFLDVIVKKEKSSNYVNDLQKTKYALNNLKNCIENKEDIQRFNACVNMVNMYVKNLKAKYENSSISLKESYIDILNTNYHAKVLGNLKYDANYYAKYIPTQQGKYSKDNIAYEEAQLLTKINKTLFLINNEE